MTTAGKSPLMPNSCRSLRLNAKPCMDFRKNFILLAKIAAFNFLDIIEHNSLTYLWQRRYIIQNQLKMYISINQVEHIHVVRLWL